jgi:hypothetical protein
MWRRCDGTTLRMKDLPERIASGATLVMDIYHNANAQLRKQQPISPLI